MVSRIALAIFWILGGFAGSAQAQEPPCRDIPFIKAKRFSERHLREISKAADTIIGATKGSDTIVFLGRSPLYVAESLESKGVARRLVRIAISGAPYSLESGEPTHSQIGAFRRYLEKNGISPGAIADAPGTFFLIDAVYFGRTIRGFTRILEDWAREEGRNPRSVIRKLELIKLTHNNMLADRYTQGFFFGQAGNSSPGLPTSRLTMDEETLELISHFSDEFNLGMHYPPSLWDTASVEENPSAAAMALRRQVREYR